MAIPQRQLPPQQRTDLKWGSHIPLNKTILKTLPNPGVMELGAGLYSTKMFFEHTKHAISIESNLEWMEKVRADGLKEDANHRLIHHSVPDGITHHNTQDQISKQVLKDAIDFYVSNMNPHLNVLFVDCYVGFRLNALIGLHKLFDVIVYHDAEPAVDKHYRYSKFQPDNDFDYYIDRTFLVHNGLLIRKSINLPMNQFMQTFEAECRTFSQKFNAAYTVSLTKK